MDTVRHERLTTLPTLRVREIVVPLDGSQLATVALPVADHLAQRLGARVLPITVVPETGGTEAEPAVVPAIGVTMAIPAADPADAIGAFVDEPGRLLITSTHGRGRVGAGLLGSVAEAVIRQLDGSAVLVGPSGDRTETVEPLSRIVVCADGSPEAETVVPTAAAWAERLGLRLDIVQVLDPTAGQDVAAVAAGDVLDSGYVRAIARQLPAELRADWEVLRGRDPVGPLLEYASGLPGTMLALATHGRSGWRRVAMGSVAMRLVHESRYPVLIQRAARSTPA
jgi:nucleotide-binding universal stress UspA family protein